MKYDGDSLYDQVYVQIMSVIERYRFPDSCLDLDRDDQETFAEELALRLMEMRLIDD